MRAETWDVDLMNFIKSRRKTPFAWGTHDCVLFAADCAQVVTGIDPAEEHRGYSSQLGAARIIAQYGSIRELVTASIGPEISPAMARRGDVVLIEQDGEQALSVCLGESVIAAGKEGLVMRSRSEAITAWRID